jgi:redox-sensitive bicupin YhaK (pirin superfamily)
MFAQQVTAAARRSAYRTQGHTRGPITRLVSPSDLGEVMKPFVFLDLAVFEAGKPRMRVEDFWHPHSGIATVTVMLEGNMYFEETTGRAGSLPAGGVEWMRAGGGVWHTGMAEGGRTRLFQLWVALPPELENGPSQSQYLMPDDVQSEGPVRVILGTYGKAKSAIDAPPLTYLHVRLQDGERWTYQPPRGHDVAFVAVDQGTLHASTPVSTGEVVVFEHSEQAIDFVAQGKTSFVLGSARRHPHELHLGSYSVHTSAEALQQGEAEIDRIGQELRASGTLHR